MTQKEFEAELTRRGWRLDGFCGYVNNGKGIGISYLNSGRRAWADRLMFLELEFARVQYEGVRNDRAITTK